MLFALLLAALSVDPALSPDARAAEPPRKLRILVLYGRVANLPANRIINEGLLPALKAGGVDDADQFQEYLDLQRFRAPAHRRDLAGYLGRKYALERFDAVVVFHRDACRFMAAEGSALFDGAPILAVVPGEPIALNAGRRRVVQAVYDYDARSTLRYALAMFPGTKEIVVVSGPMPDDAPHVARALEAAKALEGTISVRHLTRHSLSAIVSDVARERPDAIVLYTRLSHDADGRLHIPATAATEIARASKAPVFGLYDSLLGSGIVGGSLLSYSRVGKETARIAVELANGRLDPRLAEIPIREHVPMFDWTQMRRWGIDRSRLPEGSILVNYRPGFWEQYWTYALLALLLASGEGGLIAYLLWNRRHRIRSEAEQRKTEELLVSYLRNSALISWLKDEEGRYAFMSDGYRQRLGLREDGWRGRTDSDFWTEGDAARFRRDDASVLDGMEPTEYIETATDAAGAVTWWLTTKFPFLDAGGRRFVGGLGIDISALKRAQAEIEQERSLMHDIMNATDVMLVYLDSDFNFVAVNDAYADNCRIRPGDLIGRNHFALYPNEENEAIFRKVRDTGVPVFCKDKPFEFPDQPDRGVTYWDWSLSPVKNPAGDVRGLVFSLRETTTYKLAALALQASDERYRRIIATANEGIVITDPDYAITYANRHIAELMGYEPGELVGVRVPTLVHPDEQAGFRERMARRQLGAGEQFDLRYRCKDGTYRWLLTSATSILDALGNFQGSFAMFTDLTDRMKAEEKRLNLERRLLQAQKLESLGIMAGGIAHDFNNILTAILGNAELAAKRLGPESPVRVNLDQIGESTRRATALARRMLACSGQGRYAHARVDLNRLAEEAVRAVETAFPGRTRIRLAPAEHLPEVTGDPALLGQAVVDLVTNAAEATHENDGPITVATGSRCFDGNDLGEACPGEAIPAGTYVWLEVADEGIGMDPETRAKIFEPFFTTKFPGRGLGLAAVQGVVRSHGGTVGVESEPGKGSVFRILLPAAGAPGGDAKAEGRA